MDQRGVTPDVKAPAQRGVPVAVDLAHVDLPGTDGGGEDELT